ncbi:hypothetical protein BBJ28_00000477 [Nothophytophthora sp. Chile5]|nr:hypothetical protein BBJ28_00000477 [Nothophytophthora sp. Chile5]
MKRTEKEPTRKPRPLVFSTKRVGRKAPPSAAAAAGGAKQDAPREKKHEAGPVVSVITQEGDSSGGERGRRRHHRSVRSTRSRGSSRSVKRMRPSRALLQNDHLTVTQCVKAMVAKKTDATLLVDKNGLLTGILTDRDIAFKVVAVGKDPSSTRVHEVMTPNPSCVSANASAIDALKQMISGQFRHLPVADNDKVVGILDIAKCLYDAISKLEHAYQVSSGRLEETVNKLFLPTLSAIITEGSEVPILSPSSTAKDAARLMLELKTSAVMVCNEAAETVGIFTSKDLLRRVVAMTLEPSECLLSDVMTANPHSATLGTTILETLHSMHNGQFLHVPVFDEGGKLVGLVDVLQVTCGVVQQMGTFQGVKNDSVQPLWDQFRSSLNHSEDAVEHEEEHEEEGSTVGEEEHDVTEGVDIASMVGRQTWNDFQKNQSPATSGTGDPTLLEENPVNEEEATPDVFVYKLADCYGNNHRFTSSADSVKQLLLDVQNRLGDHTIRRIHYVDDEGDHDSDLKDAVRRARMWGNKYIRLMVPHHRLASHRERLAVRRALAHNADTALGMVYYAAAAAAIAGASFFLSRRK